MPFLSNLFKKPPTNVPAENSATQLIAAAAAHGETTAKEEYEQFCAGFYCRPGVKMVDFMRKNHITHLQKWLHWQTPEPEPKALVRMALDLMARGQNIWDVPGLSLHLHGRWDQGGGPSKASQDGLSLFAQVIRKTITVSFQETEDGPVKVLDFNP